MCKRGGKKLFPLWYSCKAGPTTFPFFLHHWWPGSQFISHQAFWHKKNLNAVCWRNPQKVHLSHKVSWIKTWYWLSNCIKSPDCDHNISWSPKEYDPENKLACYLEEIGLATWDLHKNQLSTLWAQLNAVLLSSCQNSVVISCPRAFWENSPERYLAFEEFVNFMVLWDNLGSL